MELLQLLSQVQPPDLSGVPAPTESIASWWPLITSVITLVMAAIAALFTAWQKIREKKLENNAAQAQSQLNLKIEEIKHQFESRKQLHEQLTQQIQNLLVEGRELRKELQTARLQSVEKDIIIAELRAEVGICKTKISFLEDKSVQVQTAAVSSELKNTFQKPPPVPDGPDGLDGPVV